MRQALLRQPARAAWQMRVGDDCDQHAALDAAPLGVSHAGWASARAAPKRRGGRDRHAARRRYFSPAPAARRRSRGAGRAAAYEQARPVARL